MPRARLPPRAVPGGRRSGLPGAGVGTSSPACQGLPVLYVLVRREAGVGINPAGEASGVPRELRGGLIGEDLWVWEGKAEAGLGRGKDKRKRGRAAGRGRTPPVPSRVLPVLGPPFPSSRFLPVASPATEGSGLGGTERDPQGQRAGSPPQAEAARPRGRRRVQQIPPAVGGLRERSISWPGLTPRSEGGTQRKCCLSALQASPNFKDWSGEKEN